MLPILYKGLYIYIYSLRIKANLILQVNCYLYKYLLFIALNKVLVFLLKANRNFTTNENQRAEK